MRITSSLNWIIHRLSTNLCPTNTMDYSYLNQAAAQFDSTCLQNGMDPTGLTNMPCGYGDLTSCSQMSQAAYRYTAAAASMARSYNPVASPVGPGNTPGMTSLHHPNGPSSQCGMMNGRSHHQDIHRSSMFPGSMNLQCKRTIDFSGRIIQDSRRHNHKRFNCSNYLFMPEELTLSPSLPHMQREGDIPTNSLFTSSESTTLTESCFTAIMKPLLSD